MATPTVEVIWKREVLGHIENPVIDNFHLYWRWVPAAVDAAEQFQSALAVALERWDEEMAEGRTGREELLEAGGVTGLEREDIASWFRPMRK